MQEASHLHATLNRIESEFQGTLGVRAYALDGSDPVAEVHYHADQRFPAASTIKVFILLTLLDKVAIGEASLDFPVLLRSADQVTGSGVLKSLASERTYTLDDLATLMIIVSDNTATNLLINHLGLDTINANIAAHGWRDSHLSGLLQRPRPADAAPLTPSYTSPHDLADLFARLWRGELLDARLTRRAQTIFLQQQYTDNLGRYIGYDAYGAETGTHDLTIASKSGSLRGVRNDAGVITTAGRSYVLAIMTKDCPDERFHAGNLGSLAISDVAKALHSHFHAESAG